MSIIKIQSILDAHSVPNFISAGRIFADSMGAFTAPFEEIEALRGYRIALQQRYGELATMGSRLVIRLERSHAYGCGIYSYLTTRRRYEDGTEALETSKRYEGKFRHQAIKDFDALVAANPAAIAEKDIEKKAWEK